VDVFLETHMAKRKKSKKASTRTRTDPKADRIIIHGRRKRGAAKKA
jgi:hypothetical protein